MKDPSRRSEDRWILLGLFGLALALRAWDLGARPASPGEAAQAWAAWRGGELPSGGSPLLAGWSTMVFALFGPDEGWMRAGSALAGALTVLALWNFLHPAGRAAAIGGAILWAVSPTAVMAARFPDGNAIAAATLAAALAFGGFSHSARWIGPAVALGIGVTAGPAFWTGVLALLPALALEPPDPAFPRWRALGLLGATVLFVGTWGGIRGSGVREAIEMLPAWWRGFSPEGLALWWASLAALVRLEAPLLLLGLAGAFFSIRMGDRRGIAVGVSAALVTVVRLARFSAPFTEHAVVLLPWTLLAGLAVQRGWEVLAPALRADASGVGFGIGGIAIGTVWMVLHVEAPDPWMRWLSIGGVIGVLILALFLVEGLMHPEEESPRGRARLWSPAWVGILGAVLLTAGLAQLATSAALIRRVDPIPGLSEAEMAAPALRDLVETLREEARWRPGGHGALRVGIVAPDEEAPFWEWTLREFRLHRVKILRDPDKADFWIAPEGMAPGLDPVRWVGRVFPAMMDLRGAEGLITRYWILWARAQ